MLENAISQDRKNAQTALDGVGATTAHRQIASLQSLRGIAALVVLVRHLLSSFPLMDSRWRFLPDFLANSHAAVVVFFVLSGFVLAPAFSRRPAGVVDILRFYVRRGFRILPLLIAVTGLSLIYVRSGFSARVIPGADIWFYGLLPHDLALSSADLVKCFLGLKSSLVPQNWTILVELCAAIFLPLLIKICDRGPVPGLLLALCCAAASFAVAGGGGKSLPATYAVDFVFGILTFDVFRRTGRGIAEWQFLIAVMGLVSVRYVLSAMLSIPILDFHNPVFALAEACFAAIVIFGLAGGCVASRWLSWTPLVWLGDISFGIYLVHFLVLVVVARLLRLILPAIAPDMRTLCVGMATVAVSIVLAWILHHMIEMPFNALGKRISGRLRLLFA